MIIEFRTANFRSIKEEQVLSFVAGSHKDMENPHHLFETPEEKPQKLLKTVCIYGPNASGKSNILLALRVMMRLVRDSNRHSAGDPIEGIVPFAFNAACRQSSSLFELTFIVEVNGVPTRFQYGFRATTQQILEEWLYAFPKGYSRCWFHRQPEPAEAWTGSEVRGKIYRGVAARTNDNVLFLSKAGGGENHPRLSPIYEWLKDRVLFPDTGRMGKSPFESFSKTNFHTDPEFSSFASKLLADADTGIISVVARERDVQPVFPNDMPNSLKEKILADLKTEMVTFHLDEEGLTQELPLQEESLGTINLFMLTGPIYETIRRGALLVIDELESSLHPLLTRALLRFFHLAESPQHGQMVFSTHQTHLLDTDYLRRDQIWFTEKNKAGSTRLYCLWDFKARKDRALEKGYLAGLFGGIPHLEVEP